MPENAVAFQPVWTIIIRAEQKIKRLRFLGRIGQGSVPFPQQTHRAMASSTLEQRQQGIRPLYHLAVKGSQLDPQELIHRHVYVRQQGRAGLPTHTGGHVAAWEPLCFESQLVQVGCWE